MAITGGYPPPQMTQSGANVERLPRIQPAPQRFAGMGAAGANMAAMHAGQEPTPPAVRSAVAMTPQPPPAQPMPPPPGTPPPAWAPPRAGPAMYVPPPPQVPAPQGASMPFTRMPQRPFYPPGGY